MKTRMTTVNSSRSTLEKKHRVKLFQKHAYYVLTEGEREQLYKALKDYQKLRKVDRLVNSLKLLLTTPEKKDLISKIRQLIPNSHKAEFDHHASKVHLVSVDPDSQLHKSSGNILQNHSGQRSPKQIRNLSHKDQRSRHLIGGKEEEVDDMRVITVHKLKEESLGFSIRGGSEHGLGIYVSEIDEESAADFSGLCPGDEILEVNDVALKGCASGSAVKVLSDANVLQLLVKRTGKIPGWRYSTEHISWFDTERKQVIRANVEEYEDVFATFGPFLNGIVERRVNLNVKKKHHAQELGFNIRGGNEFRLGIFVSRVDKNGLAEQKGIRAGDQILSVNGRSFEAVTHSQAVQFLSSQTQLVLTVRYIGRFPIFKELYAKYQWLTKSMDRSRTASRATSHSEYDIRRLSRLPHDTKIEVYTQTDEEESSEDSSDMEEVLPLQTEIIMPHHTSQFLLTDQQLNSSGSDLEDLVLEDFDNSLSDLKDLPVSVTPSPPDFPDSPSKVKSPSIVSSHRSRKSREGKKKKRRHADNISTYSGSIRQRGVFEKSFGSQIMHQNSIGACSMMTVENRARDVLDTDEATAVIRHIHTYKENKDIERLVQLLLVILDKPGKILLLSDIRGVIEPTDIGRFDSMVGRYEMQAAAQLKNESAKNSPVRHVKNPPPRQRMLLDPVTDLRGSFHLEEHSHFTSKYRTEEVQKRHRELNNFSSDSEEAIKITNSSDFRVLNNQFQSNSHNLQSSPSKTSTFKSEANTANSIMPIKQELSELKIQPSSVEPKTNKQISALEDHTKSTMKNSNFSFSQSAIDSSTRNDKQRILRDGYSSADDDVISVNSLGSTVSSVDSTPVAFDDLHLPSPWKRSNNNKKVEIRSYALVKSLSNEDLSTGQSIPRKHSSVRDSETSPKRQLSDRRADNQIRYITSMARRESPPRRDLSTPPPPLLIASVPSAAASSLPHNVPPPVELSPLSPPPVFKDIPVRSTVVKLSKALPSLGLSISGGRESKTQPEVRVENIFPGGSASSEGTLQAGMQILSIDGTSLEKVTHAEAVDIIRKAWTNNKRTTLDIEVDFTV